MRYLSVLIIFLCSVSTGWAMGDQEVLYVRPVGACSFSGNGTAYGCAASTNAAGAFIGLNKPLWSATDAQVGKIDPNDILYVCGTHDASNASFRLAPTTDGNATDGHIILDGACPNDPGVIDGKGAGVRLVQLDTRHYFWTRNLTIQNASGQDYAMSIYYGGSRIENRFMIVENCRFLNNATLSVIDFWGHELIVTGNYFDGAGSDVVHIEGGKNVTYTDNICINFSQVDPNGDCLQFNSTMLSDTGTTLIQRNYCKKETDLKYCFLVGDRTGYTEISDNYTECPFATANPIGCSPILVEGKSGNTTFQIRVWRNTIKYGHRCLTLYGGNNPNDRQQVIGNVIIGCGSMGVWVNSTTDNVLIANNTIAENGLLHITALGEHGVYIGKQNSTAVTVINNLFYGNYSGIFYTGTIGATPTYNGYYGQVGFNIHKAGTGSIAVDASEKTEDPKPLPNGARPYRLDGPSPLRKGGTAVDECLSRDGQLCNSPPDIGAYQAHHGGVATGVSTYAAGPKQ